MGVQQRFEGIVISHLGNISGRNPERENTLSYIREALDAGWHVCVRVRYANDAFMLPHASGWSIAPPAMLSKQRIWCYTDDAESMDALCGINAHAFFLTENMPTLTTAQFVWTLPPHRLATRSIAAFPELTDAAWLESAEPAGVCSNEPLRYI
jgi:hypothetical protein